MKTIKVISGDILLLLYTYQRAGKALEHEVLEFIRPVIFGLSGELEMTSNSELAKQLLEISNIPVDVFNALNYLNENNFIKFKREGDMGGDYLAGLRVLAAGIDIIEGIERGEKEKREFNVTFNIKVDNDFHVDSLIKAQLGSILKGSLVG